jgi:hypothetical protein
LDLSTSDRSLRIAVPDFAANAYFPTLAAEELRYDASEGLETHRELWIHGAALGGCVGPEAAGLSFIKCMQDRLASRFVIELIQTVPEVVDGPLFSKPNMITETLNICDDISREHEKVFPRIG